MTFTSQKVFDFTFFTQNASNKLIRRETLNIGYFLNTRTYQFTGDVMCARDQESQTKALTT